MRQAITHAALLASMGTGILACEPPGDTPAGEPPPVHVDSVFPIAEEIRRFRADLPEEPTGLGPGAAPTRDRLVQRFVDALAMHDTVALRSMVIDRTEFAYLYYPSTRYTRKPYELSPTLLWFQIQQSSEKGIARALQTYGGQSWRLARYECPDSAVREDANLLWDGCVLHLRSPAGDAIEKRLFGAILERGNRFKFLSFGNDL